MKRFKIDFGILVIVLYIIVYAFVLSYHKKHKVTLQMFPNTERIPDTTINGVDYYRAD
jgi:hypothetical protein